MLVPHPPNFTPIGAIALFGGALFADRRAAFLAPSRTTIASDLVLGVHVLLTVALATLLGSCVFFSLALGKQLVPSLRERTLGGLSPEPI